MTPPRLEPSERHHEAPEERQDVRNASRPGVGRFVVRALGQDRTSNLDRPLFPASLVRTRAPRIGGRTAAGGRAARDARPASCGRPVSGNRNADRDHRVPAKGFFVSFVIFVVSVVSAPAFAQTPAQPAIARVTFEEAIRRALAQNPTVAHAATAIAQAELLLSRSRAFTRPLVTANVVNSTLDSARGFGAGVVQPRDQVTFSADVSMPVLAPSRWAALAQSRDQVAVSEQTLADVRRQVAVAAGQAYLAVVTAHRQVDVETRALETARAHHDYAAKRLAGGAGSRLNELRAGQAVSSQEARLENIQLALQQAQEALGVLLAETGPVDVEGEPALEVPAAAQESEWMEARPDLLFQRAVTRAAERVFRDSWRDVAPSATATFTPQYITPAGLFQPSRTWRLTVSFTQPLYQGGQQRAVSRLRGLEVDRSKLVEKTLEIRARSEVRLAQTSLASHERALERTRQAATQANEVLRITTTAFDVGATTNLEVIDAQRSARDAEAAVTLAEDVVRRAKLDLLVALGRFPR
jgi:outer membrane protein TolC